MPFLGFATMGTVGLLPSLFLLTFVKVSTASITAAVAETTGRSGRPVTYGSALTIQHVDSKFYLFSAKISWGSGSGQQAVTAMPSKVSEVDTSLLWYIRESGKMASRPAGEAVKCDDYIRLEHVTSNRNLHSHELPSPISQQFEVSAYGEDGEGDDDDTFQLVCSSKGVWKTGDSVQLRHSHTGGYLTASKQKRFNSQNCPRCPIQGHLEVAVSSPGSNPTAFSFWTAEDGALLSHEVEEDSVKQSNSKQSTRSQADSSSDSSADEDL